MEAESVVSNCPVWAAPQCEPSVPNGSSPGSGPSRRLSPTRLSVSVLSDVHPDHHADRLPQPLRLRLSGDALHAQSLRHPLPPRAERSQAQAQLQGENLDRDAGAAASLSGKACWLLLARLVVTFFTEGGCVFRGLRDGRGPDVTFLYHRQS